MRTVILASLLHAALANADHHTYARTQTFQIDTKGTPRTKPTPPVVAKPWKATIGADQAMAIAEAQEPIKHEQEALLIQLVTDTPDADPDKPDYLFRLAEQYAGELRLWRLRSAEYQIAADAH
ncbi:MAG: hypothetical protein ABI591_23530 [Kofleriaceae bacterium]